MFPQDCVMMSMENGLSTGRVASAEDAYLVRYGRTSVCIVILALEENRLGSIHRKDMQTAVAYAKRVTLDPEVAEAISRASRSLGLPI